MTFCSDGRKGSSILPDKTPQAAHLVLPGVTASTSQPASKELSAEEAALLVEKRLDDVKARFEEENNQKHKRWTARMVRRSKTLSCKAGMLKLYFCGHRAQQV